MFIYVVVRLHHTLIKYDQNHYNDNNYRDDDDDYNIDQRDPVGSR